MASAHNSNLLKRRRAEFTFRLHSFASDLQGWTQKSCSFIGFRSKALGGYLKKGSKSIHVIYWKTLEFENDDKIKRIPILKYYNVFNVDCVEGVKLKHNAPKNDYAVFALGK